MKIGQTSPIYSSAIKEEQSEDSKLDQQIFHVENEYTNPDHSELSRKTGKQVFMSDIKEYLSKGDTSDDVKFKEDSQRHDLEDYDEITEVQMNLDSYENSPGSQITPDKFIQKTPEEIKSKAPMIQNRFNAGNFCNKLIINRPKKI